jgi:hypothetical protein
MGDTSKLNAAVEANTTLIAAIVAFVKSRRTAGARRRGFQLFGEPVIQTNPVPVPKQLVFSVIEEAAQEKPHSPVSRMGRP